MHPKSCATLGRKLEAGAKGIDGDTHPLQEPLTPWRVGGKTALGLGDSRGVRGSQAEVESTSYKASILFSHLRSHGQPALSLGIETTAATVTPHATLS